MNFKVTSIPKQARNKKFAATAGVSYSSSGSSQTIVNNYGGGSSAPAPSQEPTLRYEVFRNKIYPIENNQL